MNTTAWLQQLASPSRKRTISWQKNKLEAVRRLFAIQITLELLLLLHSEYWMMQV